MASWDFLTRPKTIKALKMTLDAALKILETTEDVLNTTPIPGAAAVITLILDVVKRQDRANKNAELTAEQQEQWRKLVSDLKECAAHPESTPTDALSELRKASEALRIQLREYAQKLEEETTHQYRPRWMTCGSDEEALQDFLRKSNEAVEKYHLVHAERIGECVMKIQRVVEGIDTKVEQIASAAQLEKDESKFKAFDRQMEMRRAPLASYNAPRRVGTLSSCSEGTRVPLLQTVADWRKDPNADRVFWLKERAGFGKTAIALSVAEQAANEGTLAASFFFSYQIPDLSNTSHFLPTIIYQLCLFGGAPYKRRFAAAIADHTGLLDAKLKDQAQKLFLDPLSTFTLDPVDTPIVIVIDALDECHREDAEDLTAFIAPLSSLDLPLKVFITSRPESQITAPFSDLGLQPRIIVDTSNKDVETYLRAELAKIPSKPSIRDLNLPRDWIKEEDIQDLLERAGAKGAYSDENSLFVYIATVVRFIGDPYACDPQNHLRIVLSAAPPSKSNCRPYDTLDTLYTRVLNLALRGQDDLTERFRAVVGGMKTMVQDNDVPSITMLEALLDLPQGEVRRTLVNLQSVIKYPDTDSALPSFHHRSFSDFLTDKDRSGSQYYIDLNLHRKCLTLGCLRVIAMSPLKAEVTNAMNKANYFFYPETSLSPEIFYASHNLPDYMENINGDNDILEELDRFIKDDFGW